MIELLERQKKLTANQWKLICSANVADLLDFFDFSLIGYVTAALTKEWSLPYWQGGTSSTALGKTAAASQPQSCPRRRSKRSARYAWIRGTLISTRCST